MDKNELLILVKKWILYLEHEMSYSKNTILSYENDLKNFLDFVSNHTNRIIDLKDIQNINTRTIRAWLSKRKLNKFLNSSSIYILNIF